MNDFDEGDSLSVSSDPCLPEFTKYWLDDTEEPSFGPRLNKVSAEDISRFQTGLPELPNQEEEKKESLAISHRRESGLQLQIMSPKKNPEAVICVICLEDIFEREDTAELSCKHRFCRSCVTRHVEAKIEANSFPVTCLDQNCGHDLASDLKGIISSALNDRLLDRQFKSCVGALPNMKHCLTPDCPGAFEVDDGVTILDCPLCTSKYCLKCSRKAHEGLLCSEVIEEGKEGEEVRAYLKDNRCRQCPQCKFWVERSEGCNHMTCRCKFEFCYQCGQKWTGKFCCGVYENAREPEQIVQLDRLSSCQFISSLDSSIASKPPTPRPLAEPQDRLSFCNSLSEEEQKREPNEQSRFDPPPSRFDDQSCDSRRSDRGRDSGSQFIDPRNMSHQTIFDQIRLDLQAVRNLKQRLARC